MKIFLKGKNSWNYSNKYRLKNKRGKKNLVSLRIESIHIKSVSLKDRRLMNSNGSQIISKHKLIHNQYRMIN